MEGLKNFDIEETAYDFTKEVAIKVAKGIDNTIFMTIKKIATENGIEKEVVLNETAIVNALKKQIPMKPTAMVDRYPEGQYECSACRCGLIANNKWKQKYCPNCGQAIDWSERND